MNIKELRIKKELTQEKASKITGIPLRTFKDYENNDARIGTIKYNYILDKLSEYGTVDREHGILDIFTIKRLVKRILSNFKIEYCYLFGSYAKEIPNNNSNVNLFIYTKDPSFNYDDIKEKLEDVLKKNVDLNIYDLKRRTNILIRDILSYGIRLI